MGRAGESVGGCGRNACLLARASYLRRKAEALRHGEQRLDEEEVRPLDDVLLYHAPAPLREHGVELAELPPVALQVALEERLHQADGGGKEGRPEGTLCVIACVRERREGNEGTPQLSSHPPTPTTYLPWRRTSLGPSGCQGVPSAMSSDRRRTRAQGVPRRPRRRCQARGP